jgi:hypothetical protein
MGFGGAETAAPWVKAARRIKEGRYLIAHAHEGPLGKRVTIRSLACHGLRRCGDRRSLVEGISMRTRRAIFLGKACPKVIFASRGGFLDQPDPIDEK